MAEMEKNCIVISPDGRRMFVADTCEVSPNDNLLTITKDEVIVAQFHTWHSWHWQQPDEPDYRADTKGDKIGPIRSLAQLLDLRRFWR